MDDWEKLQMRLKNRDKDKKAKQEVKMDKIYKHFGMETTQETRDRLQYEQDQAYEAVSLETKQKFLDLMWEGKNVGEAAEAVGIDSSIGAQIILRNAVSVVPTKAKV